jgi:hypothetical protein
VSTREVDPLPPLPPEIERLLSAERRAPPPAEARAARILARVEVAVGLSGSAAAAGTGAGAAISLAKLAVVGVLVGGIGAIGIATFVKRPSVDLPRPGAVARASAPPVAPAPPDHTAAAAGLPATAGATVRAAAAPVAAPLLRRTATAPPAARLPAPAGANAAAIAADLVAEAALLEDARAALVRGDARTALQRVAQHARTYRRGHLVEEREAVWIRALVLAGDSDAARQRAAAFRRRFPGSLQTEAIAYTLRDVH